MEYIRRIFIVLFSLIFVGNVACGAEAVNVEYIHKLIKNNWDVDITYANEGQIHNIANMKYLLAAVDIANYKINGWSPTNWANSKYATLQAADTIAAQYVVENLIKRIEYPFNLKTTDTTKNFQFSLSAKGTFYVNWGDGKEDVIERTNTTETVYTHTYDEEGHYTIKLDGRATAYSNESLVPAISFKENPNIAEISGSLGIIFPTLANGNQPKFYYTFADTPNLSGQIPPSLFVGLSGKPIKNMFYGTFHGAKNITGSIPDNLFAVIEGEPTEGIFYRTFENCTGLTGSIPSNLFAGIRGAPARDMFHSTFEGCIGLTGSIPSNLFAGIRGAPAQRMYNATFSECSGLTGDIPDALFGHFDGQPQELMFGNTLFSCSGLTGHIPSNLFMGIHGQPAKRMFEGTFNSCSGLDGFIPAELFAEIEGTPAEKMFYNTFAGCSNLDGEIPAGLFAKISGDAASQMFYRTFYNCQNLRGIQDGAFGILGGNAQPQMFRETFYRNYGLTGYSAKSNGKYLYEIWPDATNAQVGKAYEGTTGLSDYADIPIQWKQ